MAQYTGLQSVLKEGLGDYLYVGFSFEEIIKGFNSPKIVLYHKGEKVAAFTPEELTIKLVRQVCQEYLDKIGGK